MKTDLLFIYEKVLDEEAKRVVDVILNLYYEKKIVNESYSSLVRKNIKKEFLYYAVEIELRTYKFLPNNLTSDDSSKYALVNDFEATVLHLEKCVKYDFKMGHKNYIKAAKKLTDILIEYTLKNKNSNVSLVKLV